MAPGEEQQGPGVGGLRDHLHPLLPLHPRAPLPQSPLRVPAPQLTRPAAAPAPGQRRKGAATHRLCRSRRLCRRGRSGGAFPPPASPWTARPQPRPPPQSLSPTAPQCGRGLSVGWGSAARVRGPVGAGRHRCRGCPALPWCSLWPQPGLPRIPAHHPGFQPSTLQRLSVICSRAGDCQIQPRISPKLALVGMASLSSLSLFKESSRTFSNRHTQREKTSLSGTHMSTRWEGFSLSLTYSLLRYFCQAMA